MWMGLGLGSVVEGKVGIMFNDVGNGRFENGGKV